MAKQDALDRIDELDAQYAAQTHATLNAHPGVRIVEQVRAELAEVRELVDGIDEAEG